MSVSKRNAKLHIPLTADELAEVEALCRHIEVSVQHVGLYAVWYMVDTILEGAKPLLPPSRFYNAEEASLPPASRQAPRLVVSMTSEYHNTVVKVAREHKTSPSLLGQSAVRQMLVRARAGDLPHEAGAGLPKQPPPAISAG